MASAAKVKVNIDTKKLDQLINANREDNVGWVISDGVEYGVYQELGTSLFGARPFLVPAFLDGTRNVERAIGQTIERMGSVEQLFAKIAFDIQRLAQDNITEKHIIDTGALHNSIKAEKQ